MTTTDATVCEVPSCRTATRARLSVPGAREETPLCSRHWAPAWRAWEQLHAAAKGGPHTLRELAVQWHEGLAELSPEVTR